MNGNEASLQEQEKGGKVNLVNKSKAQRAPKQDKGGCFLDSSIRYNKKTKKPEISNIKWSIVLITCDGRVKGLSY